MRRQRLRIYPVETGRWKRLRIDTRLVMPAGVGLAVLHDGSPTSDPQAIGLLPAPSSIEPFPRQDTSSALPDLSV